MVGSVDYETLAGVGLHMASSGLFRLQRLLNVRRQLLISQHSRIHLESFHRFQWAATGKNWHEGSMLFANRRAPLITSGLHFEDIPISPVLLGVVEELVSPVHKIF